MAENYFDKVYQSRNSADTRALYDDWSASYEASVAENGYATPGRCAAALANQMSDRLAAPVLDFGCGTGLSGLALRLAGFSTLDGCDLSQGMLDEARKKSIYRTLKTIGPDAPLPHGYAAIAAIGVIGAGAAPLAALDRIVAALGAGGMCVFSFNDHTLQDPAYPARIAALTNSGELREVFREHGDHLPGLNMKSTVYILEKA